MHKARSNAAGLVVCSDWLIVGSGQAARPRGVMVAPLSGGREQKAAAVGAIGNLRSERFVAAFLDRHLVSYFRDGERLRTGNRAARDGTARHELRDCATACRNCRCAPRRAPFFANANYSHL